MSNKKTYLGVLGMLLVLGGGLIFGCGQNSDNPTAQTTTLSSPSNDEIIPANAKSIGGLDVAGYCRQVVKFPGTNIYFTGAENVSPYNVTTWRCTINYGGFKYWTEVSMDRVCQRQYGSRYPGKTIIGQYTNYNNAYSWYCDLR